MFIILTICFAITAILMVVFARHSLPQTWIAFVILSAILSFCGNWAPHIASPWPMIAGIIWLVTALVVFEARSIRPIRSTAVMIIMIFALTIIAVFAPRISSFSRQDTISATPVATVTTPTYTTWKMGVVDYGNHRWFADGLAEIKNLKTNVEASSAANAWLEKVKTDPNLLVGATSYLLNKDVDKTTLINKDGWATDKAVQLVAELELALGQSKVIAADAPDTGYNSGVENGIVVGSTVAGINGDRKAIQITLPDGKVVWVMGRCGNIVTKGSPPVPPGKTDQPPVTIPPVIPPVTVVVPIVPPPYHPPTLTPKASDLSGYPRPGIDNTTDSGTGTGTKPKATGSTSPESTPPVVKQTVVTGNIIDTPANKPGAETAGTAPGATPASTPTASTPVAKPAPEPGVNPGTSTGSNTNTTTPANPFQ